MGRQAKQTAERRANPDRAEAARLLVEQIRTISSEVFRLESMLLNCRPWMVDALDLESEEQEDPRDDFEDLVSALPDVERELKDYLMRTKNAALAAFRTGKSEAV